METKRHAPLHLPMIIPALLIALLSLIPLGFIAWIAVTSGWDVVQQLVLRPKVVELLFNTLVLVALTLPIAIALTVTLAWLVERTDLPFARLWSWLMVAPLAVAAFVHSYAWASIAPGFHGLPGAVLVSILAYFPFLYLPIAAQLRRLDPTLEETAASLGHRPIAIFLTVVLPQLRLAICGGALLIGLHLLAEYGLFVLMRFDTFATAIVDQFQSVYNGPAANLLGGVLVLLCLALLRLEVLARGDERYARVGSGAARHAPKWQLRRYIWLAALLPALVTVLAVGIPESEANRLLSDLLVRETEKNV
ncbi:MAG: iron ABC transporter permease, partial [Devosia sp.]